MSDRPIDDSVEGLTEVRDSHVPREVDGVLEIVRDDVQNVRRLVEKAITRTGDTPALRDLDAVAARMTSDVRGLGDELASAMSRASSEIEALRLPSGRAGIASPRPALSLSEPTVIHVSATGSEHAEIRRNPPPNHVIVLDDTAVYTTDEHGRVVRAEATLTEVFPGRPRDRRARETLRGKLPTTPVT